jgi:Domain of unknown function (DUF4160)
MPTVLLVGQYRFFSYSGDRDEPPHVHVERERNIAKFWLDPIRLAESGGSSAKELNGIERLVEENRERWLRRWNEYFSD